MNPQALGIIDMTLKSDDEMSDESEEIIDEEVEKELKGIVKEDMDEGRSDGMSARDGFNETFNDMDTREDYELYASLEDVCAWFEEEGGDEIAGPADQHGARQSSAKLKFIAAVISSRLVGESPVSFALFSAIKARKFQAPLSLRGSWRVLWPRASWC